MTRWKYMGDVSLEYGGTFYDFSSFKDGYVDAVEVTDLDSAAGFRGAVMIERKSIIIDETRVRQSLSVIGASFLENGDIDDNGRIVAKGTAQHRFIQAYACQVYGHCDTDSHVIVQLERDGPMQCDGWKAKKRLRANASLERYVRREFLR
jgi:hypothetical protein